MANDGAQTDEFQIDVESAKNFLNLIWRGYLQGNIIICNSPIEGRWANYVIDDIDQLNDVVDQLQQGNVYFSATSLESSNRDSASVMIPGFWADLDYRSEEKPDGIPVEDVDEFISKLPHKPTLQVNTGNGIHLWWLFDTPILIKDENYIYTMSVWWKTRLRAIAKEMKFAPDSVYDLKRIMRLPGFYNYKSYPPKYIELISVAENYISFQDLMNEYEVYKEEHKDEIVEGDVAFLGGSISTQNLPGGAAAVNIGEHLVLKLTREELHAAPPMSTIQSAVDNSHDFQTIWTAEKGKFESASERDFALCKVMHKLFFTPQEMAATIHYLRTLKQENPAKVHATARTIITAKIENDKKARMMGRDRKGALAALSSDLFQHSLSGGVANISRVVKYEAGANSVFELHIYVHDKLYEVEVGDYASLKTFDRFETALGNHLPPTAMAFLQKSYKKDMWNGHYSMLLQHADVVDVPVSNRTDEVMDWISTLYDDAKIYDQRDYEDSETYEDRDNAYMSVANGHAAIVHGDKLCFNNKLLRDVLHRRVGENISRGDLNSRLKRANVEYSTLNYTNPIKNKKTSMRVWKMDMDMLLHSMTD